jgi:hypothetical protein
LTTPIDADSPESVLLELSETCQEMRKLISGRLPQALIGYLWAQVLSSLLGRHSPDQDGDGDGLPSVSSKESAILFAMEYIHATIATDGIPENPLAFEEGVAEEIIKLASHAIALSFQHGFVSTIKDDDEVSEVEIKDHRLAFQIMSNWVMVRGRRYQVLEQEFFSYVLAPHDAKIQEVYGVSSDFIAEEIQKVANAPRTGFDDARIRLIDIMASVDVVAGKTGQPFDAVVEAIKAENPQLAAEAMNIFNDMFNGGLFNMSRHSDLPAGLLEDLAYEPGEATRFFDGSELSGTPFKALPARFKPILHLDDGYYCTEPNFIRDASYRSIQRALIGRDAGYHERWNALQKRMSEDAFPDLMSEHLIGASVLKDVYYPIGKNQWSETDCVIIIDDILINVEAKAGSEALTAPAEDLSGHVRRIEELVKKAYQQSKRFIDYVHSHDEVPLYEKNADGTYAKTIRVSHKSFRKIFPIGLTVEAFSPFSASIKEDNDVTPIQGIHNFISLSIDDLMVLRRILRGTGEFLHYLDVRQVFAGMRNVMLFDEMDHLGAYISKNRADQRIQDIIDEEGADFVWVDGMDQDVVGPYFANPEWPDAEPPSQKYPEKAQELLTSLESTQTARWLEADSLIRDLGGKERSQFAEYFETVFPILEESPIASFAMGGDSVIVFGLMTADTFITRNLLIKKAEVLALAFEAKKVRLFQLAVRPDKEIYSSRMVWVAAPSIIRNDYGALLADAKHQRARLKPI